MNKNFIPKPFYVDSILLDNIQKATSETEYNIAKIYFSLFTGKKTIQTFDDSPAKRKSLARIIHFDGEIPDKTYSDLQKFNSLGAGIYLTINETNGKGRLAEDVIRVRSVFADLDGSPLAPALERNPTLVVESSDGKFHCYWFVADMPKEAFSPMQKNIARILNGDKVVNDLPRVLRVPGYLHQKQKPFLTKITGGLGTIFTYRALTEMFPPEPVKQWTAKRYQLDKKHDIGEFRGQYGAPEGTRVKHIMRRVGGCLKRGKSVDYTIQEVYKEALACQPALTEKEIQPIIDSVKRYAVGG